MNYIDIKEAVKITGKSDKTIRRFLAKSESKPYLDSNNGKILVDVNYIMSSFPVDKEWTNSTRQSVDIDQGMSMDTSMLELQNKINLYEQEIKHKDQLLAEKEGRIIDLQKAMLLLNPPADQQKKKKSWWQF
jgi:Fic family protein